jgi:hypothetical protein
MEPLRANRYTLSNADERNEVSERATAHNLGVSARRRSVREVLDNAATLLGWATGQSVRTQLTKPDLREALDRAWDEIISKLAEGPIEADDTREYLELLDDIRSCQAGTLFYDDNNG